MSAENQSSFEVVLQAVAPVGVVLAAYQSPFTIFIPMVGGIGKANAPGAEVVIGAR
jgi:hypothetical protein